MFLSEHRLNSHHLHRIKFSELNEIYLFMTLRSFLVAMASIFIPIYLYNLHYSIQSIILYYFYLFLFEAIFEIVSSYSILRFGPKHNIALSVPFLILHFFMLSNVGTYRWPFWLLAMIQAISMALFWQGYHFDFSKAKHRGSAGKEVSKMYIMLWFVSALAPFFGGFIAENYGMQYVYLFVLIGLILALIPLLSTSEPPVKDHFILKRVKIKDIYRQQLSYAGSGIEASVSLFIWPFFVYLIVLSYQMVGALASLASLAGVFTTYMVGKKTDKKIKSDYIKRGSYLTGVSYFLRLYAKTASHVLLFNVFGSICHAIFLSPWFAEYYLHADEESRLEYLYIMEVTADLSRVIFFGLIFVFSLYFSLESTLILGILIGGLASFMISVMPLSKVESKIAVPVN
ncbi:MAG: Major facilitator superfamily [candidate division CPR2 bacterium GW2011_GWC1_39_9]|uniref:Major facilitator superfamily n=1 Tax=candidate division CPR2 bacterium GW2011_GWC2_39_10 TaxID=1618345 RepID=A0A0G0P6K0_UNCC2|nr:MAG: Major facilitator superfamily [candidate division CPR2 bacterium GW2011_GWC2_39_10]KKR34427.1 MAG: Major facilitator superfamily [candidate division CPR2 bacterium GW2011_GWC1_39_9]